MTVYEQIVRNTELAVVMSTKAKFIGLCAAMLPNVLSLGHITIYEYRKFMATGEIPN